MSELKTIAEDTVVSSVPSAAPNSHLLFVDDEQRVLDSIRRTLRGLRQDWHLSFANSVDEALVVVAGGGVDVVITDFNMPGRDGFDLMRALRESTAWQHIPVLVLTGNAESDLKRKALQAGAFDLVNKPISTDDLIARIQSVLRTKQYADELASLNATLERKVEDRTRALEQSQTDIMLCLAMAGECRDSDTGHHLVRVAHYSRILAQSLGLEKPHVERIFKASPLHDIGKLGIPDNVLRKPGSLTEIERTIMQKHCEIGYHILTGSHALAGALEGTGRVRGGDRNPLLDAAATIALYHHERWDGTGYPHGIRATEIPYDARIVAVADVYDALTTRRSYKEAFTHEKACRMILDGASTQFDVEVTAAFERCATAFDDIRKERADDMGDHQGTSPTLILSRTAA